MANNQNNEEGLQQIQEMMAGLFKDENTASNVNQADGVEETKMAGQNNIGFIMEPHDISRIQALAQIKAFAEKIAFFAKEVSKYETQANNSTNNSTRSRRPYRVISKWVKKKNIKPSNEWR